MSIFTNLNPLRKTSLLVLMALASLWPSMASAGVDPNDNEIWWGYYKDTDNLLGMGSGENETYDCAIQIYGTNTQLVGHQIRAVRFVVQGTETLQNVSVWLASSLPFKAEDADICRIEVPSTDLQEHAPTEVLLETPYTITESGVYVGFSVTQTENYSSQQAFPILTTNDWDEVKGSNYMKSTTSWRNWTDFNYEGYGKMAIQVLVDGDYQKNSVRVSNFGEAITVRNDSVSVPLTFTNYGTRGISEVEYTISTNGEVEFTRHMTLEKPFMGYGCAVKEYVTLYADPSLGSVQKVVAITRVNGEENEAADNYKTASGTLITLDASAPHRTVYEEFTATWAGASPRGISGKKLLKEEYPDNAIWISVHGGTDAMAIPEYQGVFNRIGLAPSGLVNRMVQADPYYGSVQPRVGFGMNQDVAADQKAVAEASINLTQPQMDSNGEIRFSTEVAFNYSRDDAPYALGFVLLADGLTGTGTEWEQTNMFAYWRGTGFYDENDKNLDYWADQPATITDMVFDDVAIAAFGIDYGLPGSISAPIVKGVTQTYPYSFELGLNQLAQHLDQLRVVALLFNTNTGEIVNAAIQPVSVSEQFVNYAVKAADFGELLALSNQPTSVPVNLENNGRMDVTAVVASVEVEGQPVVTRQIDLDPALPFGNHRTIQVPVDVPETVKDYNVNITISQVNGNANEAGEAIVAKGVLRGLSQAFPRKTFVEEFTGTWCGFCPRGTLGLQLSEERCPGKFVAVAVHGNDVMEIADYKPILSQVLGFPTSFINRAFETDPYMGFKTSGYGLDEVIEAECEKLTEASVAIESSAFDESTKTVTVNAATTFFVNSDEASYGLGFILVEDGLTGSGSKWRQHNYYSSYKNSGQLSDDPDIQVLIEADEYLYWPYNHVPIAAAGVEKGIEGSIVAPLVAGQKQTFTHSFDLTANELLQDPEQLKVVAIVFNTKTGQVVNVEEVKVGEASEVVLPMTETATSSAKEFYTIDGRRVDTLHRGVNIVRLPDGSVRKVIVKD